MMASRPAEPLPPVGRLAPSPTGQLHLGHARTFLIAWWRARSRGGRVVLRIEDLDTARIIAGMADAALRDLEWLGLDWDGPVVVQSERLDALNEAVNHLADRGLAYPCVCSRADIRQAQSAPQRGVTELRYPGTCRGRFESIAEAERRSGKQAGRRFLVPEGLVEVVDDFASTTRFDVQGTVGDFLVARRDRAPAYQLAVVVDDAAQSVTEVVRADDLLPSTARQLLLQRALDLPRPRWVHVPLVVNADGQRLSKRSGARSLADLRARGLDPRRIATWAAKSIGIEVENLVTPAEVLPQFSLKRAPHHVIGEPTFETDDIDSPDKDAARQM